MRSVLRFLFVLLVLVLIGVLLGTWYHIAQIH